MAENITQALVRELLDYDQLTGQLTWRATGARADKIHDAGYFEVRIDGKPFLSHRLIWLWMTGRWPKLIDHRNMNGQDNTWINLRETDKSGNGANRGAQKNNKLGVKGVSICKTTGTYRADIKIARKTINLGRYRTKEEAAAAYARAAKIYFGEFARH